MSTPFVFEDLFKEEDSVHDIVQFICRNIVEMKGLDINSPKTVLDVHDYLHFFQELMEEMYDLGYCERSWIKDFYTRFDPMMLRCVLDEICIKHNINLLFVRFSKCIVLCCDLT